MSNFGYALSQGLAAGAGAGVGMINQQLSEEADARAADRKLAVEERLMAVRDSFSQRAEERSAQLGLRMKGEERKQDMAYEADPTTVAFKDKKSGEEAKRKAAADLVSKDSDLAWNSKNLQEEARQKRVLAQAGHIVSPTEAINVEMSKLKLDDQKRIRALQDEYENAPPDKQAKIVEKIQLISGKDNDSYSTLPVKDETGAITGYQIFDKKRGTLKNSNEGGNGLDPKLAASIKAIEEAKRAKNPPLQAVNSGLVNEPTSAPVAPPPMSGRNVDLPEKIPRGSGMYRWNGKAYPDEASAMQARQEAADAWLVSGYKKPVTAR